MAGGIFPDSMFPVWLFTGFVFPQQTKPRILRREQESFVTGIRECPSKRFLHSLLSAIQREISSYSIYGKKYKKENGKVHCLTDIFLLYCKQIWIKVRNLQKTTETEGISTWVIQTAKHGEGYWF